MARKKKTGGDNTPAGNAQDENKQKMTQSSVKREATGDNSSGFSEPMKEHTLESLGLTNTNQSRAAAVDMSGMTPVQKKNLKRKLRKQEERENEKLLSSSSLDQKDIADPTYTNLISKMKQEYSQLKSKASRSDKSVETEINQFCGRIDSTIKEESLKLTKPIRKADHLMEENQKVERDILDLRKKIDRMKSNEDQKGVEGESLSTMEAAMKEKLHYLGFLREQKDLNAKESQFKLFSATLTDLKKDLTDVKNKSRNEARNQRNQTRGPRVDEASAGASANDPSKKDEAVRRKVKNLDSRYKTMGDDVPLQKVKKTISKEAYDFFFKTVDVQKNGRNKLPLEIFQRRFKVLLEKNTADANSIFIVGLESSCVDRASAIFDVSDFAEDAENSSINIKGEKIGRIIGPQGSTIQKVEGDFDCWVLVSESHVRVFGFDKKKISEAVAAMKEVVANSNDKSVSNSRQEQSANKKKSMNIRMNLSPVLFQYLDSSCSRDFFKELHSDPKVYVRLQRPRGKKDQPQPAEPVVIIEAPDKNHCTEVEKKITDYLESLAKVHYEAPEEYLEKLETGKYPYGRRPFDVAVAKEGDKLLLVGKKEAIDRLRGEYDRAVKVLSRIRLPIELEPSQLSYLLRYHVDEMEKATGARIFLPRNESGRERGGYRGRGRGSHRGGRGRESQQQQDESTATAVNNNVVTVEGDDKQAAAGKAMVERYLSDCEKLGASCVVRREYVPILLANYQRKLREIEGKYKVSIILNKKEDNASIVPKFNSSKTETAKEDIDRCVEELQALQQSELFADIRMTKFSENAAPVPEADLAVETKDLKARSDIISIIGTGGGRLKSMIEYFNGGLHSIKIIDADDNGNLIEKPQMIIKAFDQDVLVKACKLVQTYIEHEGRGQPNIDGHGGHRGEHSYRGGRGADHNNRKQQKPQQPIKVDANDITAFPSLEAA